MAFKWLNCSVQIFISLFCRVLASLNLPAAIEDLSGSSVPPSVLEKAAELKKKGGLAAIDSMMQNLPDMLMRNQELLDEVFMNLIFS